MNKIIFNYEGVETEIQCIPNDKMKKIILNFGQKTGIDVKNLIFYYNGSIINEELELNKLENIFDKKRKIMNVLAYNKEGAKIKNVFEKSKEVICPDCGENALVDINNNKFNIFGCINGHHLDNLSTKEFLESQNIDISKILCDICKTTNKSGCFGNKFYYCLKFKANLCVLCNSVHDAEHKIVEYEQKNYFCLKHFSNYIKYCK